MRCPIIKTVSCWSLNFIYNTMYIKSINENKNKNKQKYIQPRYVYILYFCMQTKTLAMNSIKKQKYLHMSYQSLFFFFVIKL